VEKIVLIMKEFVEDNIYCIKDILMTYVSFIINEITGSEEKKTGGTAFVLNFVHTVKLPI